MGNKTFKIGEYIRIKRGYIGKIINIYGGYKLRYQLDIKIEIDENTTFNRIVYEDNILKHSTNILDLIEVRRFSDSI